MGFGEMNICRYCDKPIEGQAVQTFGYWSHFPFVCHAKCKVSGERQEAIDCQIIDADCNDCKHYQRGKLAPPTISRLHRKDGTIVDVVYQPQIFIGGYCLKFSKPTSASPNKWSGLECFEHRRAI